MSTPLMLALQKRLSAQTDIAWLAAFRFLFFAMMCASMARFIAYEWIDAFYVTPKFHFHYFGFAWVKPLSAVGMHLLFWGLAITALLSAIGWRFRISALFFAVGFSYLQLVDVSTYLNHYYLAALLAIILAVSPAHRAFSFDALRGERTESIPALWLWLLRFQIAVVYSFAGFAKFQTDWLLFGQPLRIWLNARTALPVLGILFAQDWAALFMSWCGFLFDSTIVWFLLFKKSRPFAYAAVIVFHVMTSILFPIGMFPVIMIMGALVFFPPSWPRRWISARFKLSPSPSSLRRREKCVPRWSVAALVMFCVVQLALPLRYLAFPGNILWHEQGLRFSWRVMVREKNGSVTFLVFSPSKNRTWHISPRRYLTAVQEREMSAQPDLILQLAHQIRREFDQKGLGPVQVFAESSVSLNGRRARPLIDPQVDLAQIEDGIAWATWIAPGPDAEEPPELRPLPATRRSERSDLESNLDPARRIGARAEGSARN